MNAVRLIDIAALPWRNGGGSTQELLVWPRADDWLLRVSVAHIDRDGSFSAFDGYERWFAVVDGTGVSLELPHGDVVQQRDSPPLHFAGEEAPQCRLLDGPTQDLNFIVRRMHGSGEMRPALPGSRADSAAPWRGLYAAEALELELDGALMPLQAGTLVWLASEHAVGWQMGARGAQAWWLSWSPR